MLLYADLVKAFNWTLKQIDHTDFRLLMDFVKAFLKEKEPEKQYIDGVF